MTDLANRVNLTLKATSKEAVEMANEKRKYRIRVEETEFRGVRLFQPLGEIIFVPVEEARVALRRHAGETICGWSFSLPEAGTNADLIAETEFDESETDSFVNFAKLLVILKRFQRNDAIGCLRVGNAESDNSVESMLAWWDERWEANQARMQIKIISDGRGFAGRFWQELVPPK